MSESYERALITDLTYIPIGSKIGPIVHTKNELSFKIVAPGYTRHCIIKLETTDDSKKSMIKRAAMNLLVWLGIPIAAIGLMLAIPFMYIAKLIKKKDTDKNMNTILSFQDETISKFEHNGETNEPLYVLIELSDKNMKLVDIIHFKIPDH